MLAATVLLAIILGVLLPFFALSARWLKRDEVHNRMIVVARSLVDEAAMAGVQPGTTEGTRDGLEWRLDVERTSPATAVAIYRLRLALRGGDKIEHFSTVLLQASKNWLGP